MATHWSPELEPTIQNNELWRNMKYYAIERKSRDFTKKYWEENPHGKIETDVVHITDDGNCVTIKASVYIHAMTDVGDHTLILKTTGIAQETKGQGGFANADAVANGVVKVIVIGLKTMSGLDAGDLYFLSPSTAGAITLTPE